MKTYSENTCSRCSKVERRDGIPGSLPLGWRQLYRPKNTMNETSLVVNLPPLAELCEPCNSDLEYFLTPRPPNISGGSR